jgi:hypothetical protein
MRLGRPILCLWTQATAAATKDLWSCRRPGVADGIEQEEGGGRTRRVDVLLAMENLNRAEYV